MRTNLRSFLVVVVLTTLLLMGMPSNDRNGASDALTTDNTGPDDINEISGAVHSQATLMKKIPDVSQRTQTANGDERTLIENDGNLYYIYSWYNTSKTGDPITVSIVSSPDGGDTWTSNIDIWDSTFYEDCLFKHLMVWKGDLYAFYGGFHSSRTYRTCYMKKTPINNWKGLTSATQLTIRSIQAQSWKVDHDDNYIYMSMIRASQWDTWFYRYDGSSWTSGTVLSNPGSAGQSSILAYDTGSGTKLLIFYARQYTAGYSNGYINMRTSTNNGNTWSSAVTVMDGSTEYLHMASLNINGTILLFGSHWKSDDIDLVISRDGGTTWTNENRIISSRGRSSLQSTDVDFSVNTRSNGKVVCLAYEGYPDEINMIYSKDWGSNWISESKALTLHTPNSFDPILADDVSYMTCTVLNGSDYDSYLIDLTEIYLDEFTPRNLTSASNYFTVNLTWGPPKQGAFNSYVFQNYKLYRGPDKVSMPLIATLGNVTNYRDVIPSYENTTYYYQVTSVFSTIGESPPGNTVSDSPLIPEPPTILTSDPGDLTIDISWSALDQEVFDAFLLEHYTVYRGIYPDALRKIAEVAGFSYHDTDIDIYPATYYYMVTYTLDTVGMGEPSNMISEKPNTYPGMPSAVDFGEITNGVKIKWKAPLDNGCCPIISYNIFKGNHTLEMDLIVSNPAGTMNIDQTDLTPGQNYYYSITAVNRLGESIRTQPLLVNYLGVSSRPRDLIAAGGEGQIELKWIEPKVTWGLPIDSYYIYKGSGSGDTSLYKTVDGDVTSYTDIVMNGIDHTYEVSAVNSFGESKKAGPVTERASTRPAKITEISVSIGNSTVLLNWEPPQDGGAELSHYTVYRSLVETNPSELEKVPIGLEMLFDQGLTNGVAYYFRVTASNSNGEGPLSDPISATPGTDPLSVNQIKASPLLYSIRLNWQFPESGGRDIETFRIYRGTSISSMHSHMDITPDISTSEQEILDEELQYGTTYFYAVSSVNSMGESILSPIVSATPFGAPSAPKIRDIEIGLNEFSISWSAPLDNGKLPILGYRFYYKEADETEWDMVELEELMIRIPNKKAGDVFQIKVTAFNQLAEGFDSEIINIELGTEPEKMDAPTILGADSSCTLTWTEPEDNGHPILNYIIYMIDEKGIPQRWETMPAEENSFTAEDLLNGIEYTFKISAVNKMGEGPMSDQVSITPMTIPNEPGELYIEDSGDEFIIIKWTIPASNGGSEITEFNLYRGTTIGMGQSIGSVSGDVFEFIDHEVENGRTYHYLVSAVNILGEGPTSNLVSATPLGTPSTPMELKMSATTDTISIEWGKPVNNGGTPILGYVLYKGQNEDDMTVLNYLGPDEISFTDEDVETGTYYYSIQAYNEEGMGQPVTDSIEVPARIPTAAILGFGAFIIPLLIGIMAVVIPLMIARSKRKKEKEVKEAMEQTETKEAVEHTIEPAGPGLPGTGVQPPQVQVPRLEQPMSIAPERTLPPAQMPLQEPQMAPQPPAAYQQQQAPPMQPAPAPIQQERPPALTSDELTYQKPEK